jgi:hypothetical protein
MSDSFTYSKLAALTFKMFLSIMYELVSLKLFFVSRSLPEVRKFLPFLPPLSALGNY